jgi:hypothetical protein
MADGPRAAARKEALPQSGQGFLVVGFTFCPWRGLGQPFSYPAMCPAKPNTSGARGVMPHAP